MHVCVSVFPCCVSCLPLLFITLIAISHRFICECVYFFSFDCEFFVKIWIHTVYVCVLQACFLLSLLLLFAALYIFVHWTVFYLTSLSVTSLSLFCYMLFGDACSVHLFCSLSTSPPPPPFFFLLFFLGCFRRYFLKLYF